MKTLKLMAFALVAALLPLTACDDKDEVLEEVTPAEISVDGGAMTFYAEGGRQRVTLTAEEDWSATCPDWISLSPTSGGAGKTEVVIDVESNYENQIPGPYRYGIVTFAGSETGTTASVTVSQEGVETVSALNLAFVNDGSEIHLSGSLIVTSVFNGGFVALYTEDSEEETPGDDNVEPSSKSVRPYAEGQTVNVMVFTEEELELGDEISLTAIKSTMSGAPVLNLYTYSVLSTGNEVGDTDATDISDVIDSYSFVQWEYVKVRVIVSADGSISLVKGNKSVEVSGMVGGVVLSSNHLVYLMGYYASTVSSTIELYVTGVEDIGLIEERVLFEEDFSWLEKFADTITDSGATDVVAAGSDSGKCRMDQKKRESDGIKLITYFCDSLCYTIYTYTRSSSNGNEVKSKNNDTFTAFYAYPSDSGGYYIGDGGGMMRGMMVISSMPEIPEKNKLSLRLTFDYALRKADETGWRVDILPAGDLDESTESIRAWTYGPGLASSDSQMTWYNTSIDMTDIDFSDGQVIGIGNVDWTKVPLSDDIDCRFYIDNIKLIWSGVVE